MASGDPPDWDKIVESHAERVYRIAFRILGSVQDAEDVSQIVFTEAIKMHRRGPVQSWTGLFVRLSTLRAIDLLRTRQETSSLTDTHVAKVASAPEQAACKELAAWLRDATRGLPDQQAAVFSLTYFEQLDRNEVAAVLNVSVETVSTTLYKARQRLLAQLKILQGE
jgi:RNA polymerase sigma-70 factor (ECF subfamily)